MPLRLQQLCHSHQCQKALLSAPLDALQECLVSLELLFWADGWDPSASTKNNRSRVHTVSATMLCIDNMTNQPFNARTFPIACGPGKNDHNSVFEALQLSLEKLSSGAHRVWSQHHHKWTTLQVHIHAFLMDQPERRGSNYLLGGNSKQHPLFGFSCNFQRLERPFAACRKCVTMATRYIQTETIPCQ